MLRCPFLASVYGFGRFRCPKVGVEVRVSGQRCMDLGGRSGMNALYPIINDLRLPRRPGKVYGFGRDTSVAEPPSINQQLTRERRAAKVYGFGRSDKPRVEPRTDRRPILEKTSRMSVTYTAPAPLAGRCRVACRVAAKVYEIGRPPLPAARGRSRQSNDGLHRRP